MRPVADHYRADRPTRDVKCTEAVEWLKGQQNSSLGNVFASFPDLSELPRGSNWKQKSKSEQRDAVVYYKKWFEDTVRLCLQKTKADGYVVLYQTDRKSSGEWISKASLANRAACAEGWSLRWRKIALRSDDIANKDTLHPTYSNVMCFSKTASPGDSSPSFMYRGAMNWDCATGQEAARFVLKFIHTYSPNRVVYDPFVGKGTTIALANSFGLDAVGIEIDEERCKEAKKLQLGGGGSSSDAPEVMVQGL